MESKIFTLEFPASGGAGKISIECGQSVAIIGANGSGKTRLGTWIEFESIHKRTVRRISAQKSLTMPDSSTTSSMEESEIELNIGYWDKANSTNISLNPEIWRKSRRWNQNPNTSLLNDFSQLMVYLFTERFEKTNIYFENSNNSQQKVELPETMLGTIQKIWKVVLPHRGIFSE